jgi:hypothetical protein
VGKVLVRSTDIAGCYQLDVGVRSGKPNERRHSEPGEMLIFHERDPFGVVVSILAIVLHLHDDTITPVPSRARARRHERRDRHQPSEEDSV